MPCSISAEADFASTFVGSGASLAAGTMALSREESINDGNGILGHILGSKAVSRQVAQQTSERTGIGADVLKKMLPMVATLAMGVLSRQTANVQTPAPGAPSSSGLAGLLGQFLDSNRDGSIADDVLGMASRFFKK